MFRDKYRTYINWGVTVVLILVAALSYYFLIQRWKGFTDTMSLLRGVLTPVTIGLVIAYILESMVNTIVGIFMLVPTRKPATLRRIRVFRVVAIILSEILSLALVSALLTIIIPQIIDSLRNIITNYDQYVTRFEAWVQPMFEKYPTVKEYIFAQGDRLQDTIRKFLQTDLSRVVTFAANSVKGVGVSVYNVVIGIIVSIYMLINKEILLAKGKKLTYALFKVPRANRLMEGLRHTDKVFRGFLVGKILDSLIVGILCFIGCTIFGMPYSLLISIFVGLTNIIPSFGPIIGAIPSIILILMVDPMKALIFAIFILVLQQLDGNVIGPKIVGGSTGVSSIGVLIAIIVGGGLFGFVGMILSVPVYSVIYTVVKNYAEKRLRKRGLPEDLTFYSDVNEIDPAMERQNAQIPQREGIDETASSLYNK
ncbi:MAG: AI-2E family transporter [Clostridia bacterium]|nr:AI-2E family transporter [Clostridia bacterium]